MSIASRANQVSGPNHKGVYGEGAKRPETSRQSTSTTPKYPAEQSVALVPNSACKFLTCWLGLYTVLKKPVKHVDTVNLLKNV